MVLLTGVPAQPKVRLKERRRTVSTMVVGVVGVVGLVHTLVLLHPSTPLGHTFRSMSPRGWDIVLLRGN